MASAMLQDHHYCRQTGNCCIQGTSVNWSWVQPCQTIVANQENLRGRSTSIQGFIPATSDIRYQHGMRCIPYNLISNVYICFSSLYADRKGIKKGNSAPRELYQTKKGRVFCHYFSVAEISFVAEIRFWDIPRSYHKISLYIQGRTDIGLGSRYHKIRPLF